MELWTLCYTTVTPTARPDHLRQVASERPCSRPGDTGFVPTQAAFYRTNHHFCVKAIHRESGAYVLMTDNKGARASPSPPPIRQPPPTPLLLALHHTPRSSRLPHGSLARHGSRTGRERGPENPVPSRTPQCRLIFINTHYPGRGRCWCCCFPAFWGISHFLSLHDQDRCTHVGRIDHAAVDCHGWGVVLDWTATT